MLYVCVRGVMDVVLCLYCDAWNCRRSCMGSMSISSCICCMSVSCVHPVASSQCCILHDFQFVNAGRGCKRRLYGRGILQSWYHDCLIGSHEGLLLFTKSYCGVFIFINFIIDCRCLCVLSY